jgi:hypothetical protein
MTPMETIARNRGTPIVPPAGSSQVRSAWKSRWPVGETIPSIALGATDFPRFVVSVSTRRQGGSALETRWPRPRIPGGFGERERAVSRRCNRMLG